MKKEDIRSVAPLNANEGSINLSACFHHCSGHATFVNVSKEDYSLCGGDKELLKQLFVETYEKSGSIKL